MLGISWVAAQLSASQEGLSSLNEWVRFIVGLETQSSIFRHSVRFLNYVYWPFHLWDVRTNTERALSLFHAWNTEVSVFMSGLLVRVYSAFITNINCTSKLYSLTPHLREINLVSDVDGLEHNRILCTEGHFPRRADCTCCICRRVLCSMGVNTDTPTKPKASYPSRTRITSCIMGGVGSQK
jgi:hypothetical protein